MSTEELPESVTKLMDAKTFDARKAITGATYPEDSIEVYSDAKAAHELNVVANDAAKARHFAESIRLRAVEQAKGQHRSVEDDAPDEDGTSAPGYAEADAEASELEAEVASLIEKLQESVLIFHLRGLAPKQWKLIHLKWQKAVKEPARKNYPDDEDGEEIFQNIAHERDIERADGTNEDCIASAITKVVRKSDGAVDTHVWTQEEVEAIHDTYLESEFFKLKNMMEQLTFSNKIFQMAVSQDADFLSKR